MRLYLTDRGSTVFQVLAATQRPGSEGKRWFQGTADAVRQFDWLFDVRVPFDASLHRDSTNMPMIWCQFIVSNTRSSYKKTRRKRKYSINSRKENILLLRYKNHLCFFYYEFKSEVHPTRVQGDYSVPYYFTL